MSGCSMVSEVTSRRREEMSGINRTPTFTADACRNGPLPKAGSSAIEMLSADAPPLKIEADSLPMSTRRRIQKCYQSQDLRKIHNCKGAAPTKPVLVT